MPLNCHTYYSFLYGMLSTADVLVAAKNGGYDAIAITDINNTSAIIDALRTAPEYGIKIVPGVEFRDGGRVRFVALAKYNEGYREINEYLGQSLLKTELPAGSRHRFNNAFAIYPLHVFSGGPPGENEFIGISTNDLPSLHLSPWRKYADRMVILQPFTFSQSWHFNAHRLMRAIDQNTLLSKADATGQASAKDLFIPKAELYRRFAAFPAIIQNTEALLENCAVSFRFGKLDNKNLRHFTGSAAEDLDLLRRECLNGLPYRYSQSSQKIRARLDKELDVIARMGFAAYFLINWDITGYARHKGYHYVGRGSGANSLAAYLLRITDVDPIDLDLYFERFINEYRSNAPDFDIDFSWTDRDDVTRYIFERYGRERTALVGSYATFQHDAVVRELGKVFGLPATEIEKLKNTSPATADHIGQIILKYSRLLHGFPSHLTVHASGILISQEPITTYTATFVPPKGYPTTQFSMLEAEDIGLFKFDILSQRGIGKIKDTVGLVKKNKGVSVDIHDVPKFKTDENVKQLLRDGKCIGCFYVESPAMRMLLAKLKADDYLRLVAESSIIRPGVSKSGMMQEYIARFRDKTRREKARAELPELYDLLEETYGVMVYQEDVIRIAHLFAGLSLAESDYLRRGMSWKFKQRDEFRHVKEKFFNNCRLKGHTDTTITNIWNQIESFANFAFSKGHSASYAVESYQALYLKAHFPLEYMVATLNNGGGFYRPEIYVHEVRMHGGRVELPCVNHSEAASVVDKHTVYLGLGLVNGVETRTIEKITSARLSGAFTNLYDFIKRTGTTHEQLRILIRCGALRVFGASKQALLWETHMLLNPGSTPQADELFELEPERFTLPALENDSARDAFDEIELLGFSLSSPFTLLRDSLTNSLLGRDLPALLGKTVEIIGYLATAKFTYTAQSERMCFGTFLDQQGAWIDTVHFPPSLRQFPFTGPGCYRLIGKVMEEYDFIYIEVTHQYRLPVLNRESAPNRRTGPAKTGAAA